MTVEIATGFLTPGEARAAFEIERASLPTAWSEAQIAACARGEGAAKYLALREGGTLRGVCSFTLAAEECEIINLAVEENSRRKGFGAKLLQAVFENALANGANRVFLEVAEGNSAALPLYKAQGFVPVGRRKNFYRGEDALIMAKDL